LHPSRTIDIRVLYPIKPGDKIVQLTLHPVGNAGWITVPESELYREMREEEHRGDGGFGSTNK